MPMIHIEYDNSQLSDELITKLSEGIQKIVSDVTQIEDVFVYANSAQIKIKIAPVEIFVRMTASKISDRGALIGEIKNKLAEWKTENDFQQPINLTLIPMDWNVEVGI